MRRGAVVFMLAWGAGCPTLSPYVCFSDSDCDRDGESGMCLPDGACAYPDDSDRCDSGWVRSPNAADDPGGCVPADPPSTSEDGTTTSATTVGPLPGSETGSGDDGTTSCGQRIPIVVDTAVLSPGVALEGYPLLVSFTDRQFASAIANADAPAFVTDADGVPRPHEWEPIDRATGRLNVWVRLPSYEPGQALRLYVVLDDAPPPNDPVAVWEDTFVGVWHMGDALTGNDDDPIRNSVRVGEPGFTSGQMQPDQTVPGVIGRAIMFDGDDDIVSIDASFVGQLSSYTISFWSRYEGDGLVFSSYFQRLNGDFFYPRCWRLSDDSGANPICQWRIDETIDSLGSGMDHDPGQLIHIALVYDADAARVELYRDGEQVNVRDTAAGTLASNRYLFEIGHGEWGTFTGMLDEFRVADYPFTAAWIDADARSQRNPASVLLDVGNAEPLPCP